MFRNFINNENDYSEDLNLFKYTRYFEFLKLRIQVVNNGSCVLWFLFKKEGRNCE